ncbi:MAG: hypothetical protein IJ790_04530, partial [Lachnospiraceae bacterium]|nr:hypothetical protein [Lachnospiraceae bacterium]
MSKFSLKKLTAVILIVTMIFTSKGLAIFAESIDDMDMTKSSAEAFLTSPSNVEDQEPYDSEYEEELEDGETTTVKSPEEETATTGGDNPVDSYDTATSSDLSDDVEEETSTLATESEIIIDIDKSS